VNNSTKKSNTGRNQAPNNIGNLVIEKVVNCGKSRTNVAADLRMNKTTVNAILKKYRQTQCFERSTVFGHSITKITPGISLRIEQLGEFDKDITLARIKENLFPEFNIHIPLATISSHLYTSKLTIKRRGLIIERVNDPTRLEMRKNKCKFECLQKRTR